MMKIPSIDQCLQDAALFSTRLYEKMCNLNQGIRSLELHEFEYALNNLMPSEGWQSVNCMEMASLIHMVEQPEYFEDVELKPRKDGRIILDNKIVYLSQMLWIGLVTEQYSPQWVNRYFYFDIRGFFFLIRTHYFTTEIIKRFGNAPYICFEPEQRKLMGHAELGFKEFNAANLHINQAFIAAVQDLISAHGTPLLLTIVGPTAAGKTEIVQQLSQELNTHGKSLTCVEMDNFYKDREFRDNKPMDENVIHFDLFQHCMQELMNGHSVMMPRYDFVAATSSHDLNGRLRPGQDMIRVLPADIILLEGNFPFHFPQIELLISIKVVYLTDDPIRLKRKWTRDVDYRKKYDPYYLCNRFFRTQMQRAREVYQPMMQNCDIVVDTTNAALWLSPQAALIINNTQNARHSIRK